MQTYTVLGFAKGIPEVERRIWAASDSEAIQVARQLRSARVIELWTGETLVMVLDGDLLFRPGLECGCQPCPQRLQLLLGAECTEVAA